MSFNESDRLCLCFYVQHNREFHIFTSWNCPYTNLKPSSRNLGVIFDHSLHFDSHMHKLAQSCFFQLQNISKIKAMLTTSHLELLIQTLISLTTVMLFSPVSLAACTEHCSQTTNQNQSLIPHLTNSCIFSLVPSKVQNRLQDPTPSVCPSIFWDCGAGGGAQVGFYNCHIQGITYHQSLLVTQMISIYISYELIHACLRPPRTPIPHAVLLSLLKITSVQFSFVRRY